MLNNGGILYVFYIRFSGVVVITSASHAEGREFEPRLNLLIILLKKYITINDSVVVS